VAASWQKRGFSGRFVRYPGWLAGFLRDGGVPKLPNVVILGRGPMPLVDVSAALATSAVCWEDLRPRLLARPDCGEGCPNR
jgi:hypothetical protein